MEECSKLVESYSWIQTLLERFGHRVDGGLLVELSSVPEQDGVQWYGTWVSNSELFYEFEVLTDYESRHIKEIELWEQVNPEISGHKKGVGKTPAFIALELLMSKKI